MNLVVKALDFAQKAHNGQTRKYTGQPYFHHLYNVSRLVSEYTDDKEIIAAAVLHDGPEDVGTTYAELVAVFGHNVAQYVDDCTNRFTKENYPRENRVTRKKLERERIAKISPNSKMIKLCDIYDNLSDAFLYDLDFSEVFLKEKIQVMAVLKEAANPDLYKMVSDYVCKLKKVYID